MKKERNPEHYKEFKAAMLRKCIWTFDRCIGNTHTNKVWKPFKITKSQNKDAWGIDIISEKEWVDHYQDLVS